MLSRVLSGAIGAVLICVAATPATGHSQETSPDTATPTQAVRPLAAVVVTARRASAFESAMSAFGLRASINTRQRENRNLARRLAVLDRQAFTLERTLDSLMVVATIQELHIARTDSATAKVRSRRENLEAMICEKYPAECGPNRTLTSSTKSD